MGVEFDQKDACLQLQIPTSYMKLLESSYGICIGFCLACESAQTVKTCISAEALPNG